MTDIYCTRCGKGLHHDDEVVITARATIQAYRFIGYLHVDGNYVELDDAPYEETLCKECYDRASQPNRVVIVLEDEVGDLGSTCDRIAEVRAERPDDVCILVKDWDGTMVYGIGGSRPIKPLLTDEEIEARWEEQKAWSEEKKDLYYTGMGG